MMPWRIRFARFDPLGNPGDEKEIASAVWTVESPGKRSSEKASRTDRIPISSSVSRSLKRSMISSIF